MAQSSRPRRVGQQLQKEVAQILHRELRDPRVGMVTVSEVEVSSDLAYAKVFVTFLNIAEGTEKEALAILNEMAPYFRSLLGKAIKLRLTPELKFLYDSSMVDGMRMSNLVTQVIAEDKRKQQNTEPDEEK